MARKKAPQIDENLRNGLADMYSAGVEKRVAFTEADLVEIQEAFKCGYDVGFNMGSARIKSSESK